MQGPGGLQRTVGGDFQNQAVIVGFLADARRFHVIVHLDNRREQGVHRDKTGRALYFRQVFGGDIPFAAGKFNFHLQAAARFQGGKLKVFVNNANAVHFFNIGGGHHAGFVGVQRQVFAVFVVHFHAQFFQIEQNVNDVFPHVGQRAELVNGAFDAHGRNGRAFHAREQNAAQRIAHRVAVTAFIRFCGKFTVEVRGGFLVQLNLLGKN